MPLDALVESWVVWNDEPESVVLAYRPNVFDGTGFPPPCLPTIHASLGRRDRRPGNERVGTDWWVRLFLEPAVEGCVERYDGRERALEGAVELADRFAAGGVDYRSLYQVPRPEYLDRLDELTGRGGPDDHD